MFSWLMNHGMKCVIVKLLSFIADTLLIAMEESVGHFGYSASYAYLTASENFQSEEENDFQSSAFKRQEKHQEKKVGQSRE